MDTSPTQGMEGEDDTQQSLSAAHHDTAAQEATRWSEMTSQPTNNESETALVMIENGNVCETDHESSACNKNRRWSEDTKLRLLKFFEVLILISIMLVIIGLLLIPTAFYASPPQQNTVITDNDCLNVEIYTGGICRSTLSSLQTCFSGDTSPPPALNIPSLIDQEAGERDATNLVNGLSLLSPSPQCREAILPFLCLSIFTLCDSSNHLHTILREDCLELRDDICAEEWSQVVDFFGPGILPDCELPDIMDECTLVPDNSSMPTNITPTANQTSPGDKLVCSDGFFFDENVTNFCKPTCGELNLQPIGVMVQRGAVSISFIASILMFILALTVERETLLVFPSVLFVYMCITTFIASATIIVGFFDHAGLFCRSTDLLSNLEKGNETLFCTISGFVSVYVAIQINMWAVLHATFLFWAVRFPLSYRQLKTSGRIRYAHIISVVLAVIVPLVVPCISLRDGYSSISASTISCRGRNFELVYYATILPGSFLVGATSCLLVVIFWTIFKEFVLIKLLTGSRIGAIRKAELKIGAIIVYYTLSGVISLASTTFFTANNTFQDAFVKYIQCESRGRLDCELVLGSSGDIAVVLTTTSIVMFYFVPVIAILFNCNTQACTRLKKRDIRLKINCC